MGNLETRKKREMKTTISIEKLWRKRIINNNKPTGKWKKNSFLSFNFSSSLLKLQTKSKTHKNKILVPCIYFFKIVSLNDFFLRKRWKSEWKISFPFSPVFYIAINTVIFVVFPRLWNLILNKRKRKIHGIYIY